MDFHSFSRRELQALCKKNKIPANMTNLAMADALKALEFVEGIEEFLKLSESESAKSSIESPEKSEITSPSVPRTGCRTSVRRKTVKDEPETLHTLTRSHRTTRRMLEETPAEAATATTRRRAAAAASVRRKIEIPSKETEEVDKEQKDVPESQATVKASRRRGVKETSGVKHAYSTRRSTRLAEKNVEKKRSEAIKIDSLAEEMDENLEINSKENYPQLSEVTDHSNEAVLEGKSNLSGNGGNIEAGIYDKEVNSIEIIHTALNLEAEGQENVKASDDGVEKKPEVYCEISDETDVHLGDNMENLVEKIEVQENNGCINAAVDLCKIEKQLELENVEIFSSEENIEIDILIEDETVDVEKKDELARENLDDNGEFESNFPKSMISTDEVNQEVVEPDTETFVQKGELIEENLDDSAELESEFPNVTVSANLVNQEEETDTEEVVGKGELTQENLAENAELEPDFPNDMILADKFNHEEEPDSKDVEKDELIEENLDDDAEFPNDTVSANVVNQEEETDIEEEVEKGELTGEKLAENAELESEVETDTEDAIGPDEEPDSKDVENDELIEENLDDDAEFESEFPNDTVSANVVNQEEETDIEEEVEKDELTGEKLAENAELESEIEPDTEDAIGPVSNDVVKCNMETSGLQTAGSIALPSNAPLSFKNELSGDAAESFLAATHPISTTPVKKNPLGTTPTKKSAGRTPKTAKRVIIVSDDKENVDSGRKLVLTKEEKSKKKKEFAVTNNQKPLEELSMRKLTKMFKEKLEITKMNSKADEIKAPTTTRPALRTLSDNCLVEGPQN